MVHDNKNTYLFLFGACETKVVVCNLDREDLAAQLLFVVETLEWSYAYFCL
jgi:hypothetical protein